MLVVAPGYPCTFYAKSLGLCDRISAPPLTDNMIAGQQGIETWGGGKAASSVGSAAGPTGANAPGASCNFAAAGAGGSGNPRNNPDQDALIKIAKQAQQKGSVTSGEAETLLEWAREYGVVPALDHRGTTHWVGGDHIRIGPVNHIQVKWRHV